MTPTDHQRRWIHRPLARRLVLGGAALTVALGSTGSAILSRALAAPLWTISGVVQTASGQPVANETIGLTVIPAGPLPKSPTPTVYIANVVSGPDGSFSIPAPSLSPDVVSQIAHNDGWLNVELDAVPNTNTNVAIGTAGGNALYYGNMALAILAGPSQVTSARLGTVYSAPNGVKLIVYQYAAGESTPNVNPGCPSAAQPICGGCPESGCAVTNPTPQPSTNCATNWYSIASETDWQPVGELHTWQDESGDFEYSQTSSTDFGVAFKQSGGNWSLSGDNYIGNTAGYKTTLGVKGQYTANRIIGQYPFEEDENDSCGTEYRIRPLDWTGGLGYDTSTTLSGDGPNKYYSVPSQNHADYPGMGQQTSKDSGTGYHYSWEVSAFGVSVGDQTNWSNQVNTTWYIGRDCSAGLHSLFSYGAPPASADAQLVFASTETDQNC